MIRCLAVIMMALSLSNCVSRNDGTGLFTVNLTKTLPGVSLNLNAIADSITLIRLETAEQCLIRDFSGYVGKNHIISVEPSKILLFSSDGKYLSQIARRGRGPGEFGQIDAWDVDEDEKSFVYHDTGKEYFARYDLEALCHVDRISFTDRGALDAIVMINDSLIAVLPGMFTQYGYLFFFQTLDGRISTGIEKEPVPHPGTWAGRAAVFMSTGNGVLVFQPPENDTLFLLSRDGMVPLLRFFSPGPVRSGYEVTGSGGRLKYINERYILIDHIFSRKNVSPGNAAISIDKIENLLFCRDDASLDRIDSFSVSLHGIDINLKYLDFGKGGRFFSALEPAELIKIVKDQLQVKAVTDDDREFWKDFAGSIGESDNPILVSGILWTIQVE
ncbi:MAG: 6-bladed beta-propeller [Bacteroidales bacterium]|jgi:hypothetical protein|nr:6-bladed beta-propeller [Bacteroidales bacterium]